MIGAGREGAWDDSPVDRFLLLLSSAGVEARCSWVSAASMASPLAVVGGREAGVFLLWLSAG